jgi:hypothetical protein
MKIQRFTALALPALLAAATAAAQQPAAPAGGKDHGAIIKESLQKSAVALKQYQWVETTVISIKGDEKSRQQQNCYYGADGALQKTPIGAPPEEKKKRGIRGAVAEDKKEEISGAAKEAVGLVKLYVPPDPARIQSAKDTGRLSVTPPDKQGNVVVVIKDYLKPGDSLTLSLNAATNLLTGIKVATFTDSAKDAVDLNVTMGAFPDGTVYASAIQLTVASQKLGVAITNSGYKKLGS